MRYLTSVHGKWNKKKWLHTYVLKSLIKQETHVLTKRNFNVCWNVWSKSFWISCCRVYITFMYSLYVTVCHICHIFKHITLLCFSQCVHLGTVNVNIQISSGYNLRPMIQDAKVLQIIQQFIYFDKKIH